MDDNESRCSRYDEIWRCAKDYISQLRSAQSYMQLCVRMGGGKVSSRSAFTTDGERNELKAILVVAQYLQCLCAD
jgi:uncharacterized C2H2 Zn-finger protein